MNHSQDPNQRPSFEVDPKYSDRYLKDNYDPETYNTIKTIFNAVTKSFDTFLSTHTKYSYLRSIDINKVEVHDRIMVIDPCCTGVISMIDGDIYHVRVGRHKTIEVDKSNIKPVDEYINKLKISDMELMYEFIRDDINKDIYSEMIFFYVFSEYFKINEKTLYNALSPTIQSILLQELNNKTGILDRKQKSTEQW